jgi:hypothetical protein
MFLVINLIYWILLCSYPFVLVFSVISPNSVVWVIKQANKLMNFFRWSNSFDNISWR